MHCFVVKAPCPWTEASLRSMGPSSAMTWSALPPSRCALADSRTCIDRGYRESADMTLSLLIMLACAVIMSIPACDCI